MIMYRSKGVWDWGDEGSLRVLCHSGESAGAMSYNMSLLVCYMPGVLHGEASLEHGNV